MNLGDSPKRVMSRMNRGMRVNNSGGYTLVEVLITMGVTAMLLVSVVITFSGRIQRTQFTQSVRALDARIGEIFNQVASGNFNSGTDYSCTIVAGAPTFVAGTTEQGTNSSCIYLGKVIQFGVEDANCSVSNPVECDTIGILSVAGRRTITDDGANRDVKSFSEANLRVVDPLRESFVTGYGLSVSKVVTAGGDVAAVGAFLSPGQNSSSLSTAGAQKLVVIPINNTVLGTESSGTALNTAIATVRETGARQKMTVCLHSGDRKAAIVINGENRQSATDVFFDNALPGECA